MTVLLVLAIAASSALVFTDRVELLKLAVVLSLWAAVAGAFASTLYRKQSDVDQAKMRDLKRIYSLQLDREISARREYELNVETHLRRELAHEIRAQSLDEVAALRAELAALRNSLEILFDADLAPRPAIETDRSQSEWPAAAPMRPDRVASSRVTAVHDDDDAQTAESPIIDVPEEPLAPTPPQPGSQASHDRHRGSHRRPSEVEETRWMPPVVTAPPAPHVPRSGDVWPAEGSSPQWMPPYPPAAAPTPPMFTPHNGQQPRGSGRRGRHSPRPESVEVRPVPDAAPPPSPRHGGGDDDDASAAGQSVAELLARLHPTGPSGGSRRRRRKT